MLKQMKTMPYKVDDTRAKMSQLLLAKKKLQG